MGTLLTALKPTAGKTIVSLMFALLVGIYMGIAGFTGGLFFGTMEAGVQSPLFAVNSTAEVFDSAIDGRETQIDTTVFEDAAKKPVKMGAEYAFSGFFKTFLWVYGIWSGIQLIGLLRKKK